mmetsp:Transcript_113288/g.320636  ORF Transcript_113288/g.320636 Transcript_113288/m.320636 type:complete len:238 (+) Transcript_113288:1282-1995(+)
MPASDTACKAMVKRPERVPPRRYKLHTGHASHGTRGHKKSRSRTHSTRRARCNADAKSTARDRTAGPNAGPYFTVYSRRSLARAPKKKQPPCSATSLAEACHSRRTCSPLRRLRSSMPFLTQASRRFAKVAPRWNSSLFASRLAFSSFRAASMASCSASVVQGSAPAASAADCTKSLQITPISASSKVSFANAPLNLSVRTSSTYIESCFAILMGCMGRALCNEANSLARSEPVAST